MGMYEDDRIRHKNQRPVNTQDNIPSFELVLSGVPLAKLVEALSDKGFKVSLEGTNTIVVK